MASRVISVIGFIWLAFCALGSWPVIALYALYPGPLASGSQGYSATKMHGLAAAAGLGFLVLLVYTYRRKSLVAAFTFLALMILATAVGIFRLVTDLSDLH